jgi:hypothetical protein
VLFRSILTAFKAQLEANTTLSGEVEVFLLGVREGVTQFPAIVIEPLSLTEHEDIHEYQELYFSISVMGYVNVKDPDKQIIGDSEIKGILDIENDLKKAISADITIGGNVYNTQIKETKYDFVDYPIRSFTMNVEFYFRQNLTART